jgi:hypothetical protein
MLDRVSEVIGAFQRSNGTFELWALPAGRFKKLMRPTRSKGPSARRVGIVARAAFYEEGTKIRNVRPRP